MPNKNIKQLRPCLLTTDVYIKSLCHSVSTKTVSSAQPFSVMKTEYSTNLYTQYCKNPPRKHYVGLTKIC